MTRNYFDQLAGISHEVDILLLTTWNYPKLGRVVTIQQNHRHLEEKSSSCIARRTHLFHKYLSIPLGLMVNLIWLATY